MMLFVGGCHQGKSDYVNRTTGRAPVRCTPEEALSAPAIDCFHLICRKILDGSGDVAAYTRTLLARNPDAVVVSDEIGLGVVPLDPFERLWREETGRALCVLAERAQRVERICCGLGMRLK